MFNKILIPTDGSPLSTQAAVAGVTFARSVGAQVVVLHVHQLLHRHEIYGALTAAYALNKVDYDRVAAEQFERYLEPIMARAKAEGVTATAQCLHDTDIPGRIVKTAEQEDCHLIFIGSHGRTGLSRLLIGSVAAKVLPLAHVPVLVYRVKEGEGA